MSRLPPLNLLRAFEIAARHQSFKLAADELKISQGAVSRQIAKLEEFLAVPLFVRLHRRVLLTGKGEAYLREIQGAFLRLSNATTSLTSLAAHSTLTIKCPPAAAIWWLVPRLGRFHERHPDIHVQVMSSHLPVNFEQEDVDVAIHYGPSQSEKAFVDRLFGEVLVAICNRKVLAGSGSLKRPQDLVRQILLGSIWRPADWPRWLKAAGVESFEPGREIMFENSAMVYQGALDGIGFALAQLAFVSGELSSKRLVTPFNIRVCNDTAYHLVAPAHKMHLSRVAAFREWIADEAHATRKTNALL